MYHCTSTPLHPAPCLIPLLIHTNTLIPQLIPRLPNLLQQTLVRLGTVVEPEQAEAERAERVGAECDEEPEGELLV